MAGATPAPTGGAPVYSRLTGLLALTVPAASSAFSRAAVETLAGGTFFAGTCFVDREGTALEVFLMEHGDGFLRVGRRTHFHEGETAGTASGAVLHDIDRDDAAGLGKVILQ